MLSVEKKHDRISLPLPEKFYQRNTVDVAHDLLGKTLVRVTDTHVLMASIIETEAYRSDDEACHAYRGITKRSAPLFGAVGHTYVYLCYGIHYCLNIVARDSSCAAGGVLLRAIRVLDEKGGTSVIGPGKIAKALSITTEHTGINATQATSEFIVTDAPSIAYNLILTTPRVGLSKAKDKPWRFLYMP